MYACDAGNCLGNPGRFTWNNEELANITTPEIALVANPISLPACAADAVAATAEEPLDVMFWCAGSWGSLYPFSGMMRASAGADPTLTSLAAIRSRAAIHRRGLDYRPWVIWPSAEASPHHSCRNNSIG